jgi:hypothetical protein
MKRSRLFLALVGASLLLGMLVLTAAAGRLSSSSQTFRAILGIEITGGFGRVHCGSITLEGSLHTRSIAKVAETLMGSITGAVSNCATILTASLPWNVRYQSFSGTLPNITSINTTVLFPALRISLFGTVCLGQFEASRPLFVTFSREVGGALTTAELNGSVFADCGAALTLSGRSSSFTVLGAVSRITVALI